MTTARLEAHGVGKTFGASTVLRDAALVVRPGEIHALVGQNGCGKSTLIKILTGYHAPDPGMSLAVDGQPLAARPVAGRPRRGRLRGPPGPRPARRPDGEREHRHRWVRPGRLTRRIDWRAQDEVARAVLERLELPVSPGTWSARCRPRTGPGSPSPGPCATPSPGAA